MREENVPGMDGHHHQAESINIASAVMGNRTKSLIVRHLWQYGACTGTELSKATGISAATLSLAMQQLEQWNVVSTDIPVEQRHGRAVTYTLDRNKIKALVDSWMGFVQGQDAD